MKKIKLLFLFSIFVFNISNTFGQWAPLGKGVKAPVNYTPVFTQAVYNSKLYFGGNFDTVANTREYSLAEWNGTSWDSFSNTDTNGVVVSMVVYNSNLIAAGRFSKVDGVPCVNIAEWNGTSWSALAGGIPGFVLEAMAVYNGNLYVGGWPWSFMGSYNIAMWNGTAWSAVGKGVYDKQIGIRKTGGGIYTLCVYNGKLYAGGQFDSAGGVAANNIASWDGTSWSAVGTGLQDSSICAFTVFNNELYVGGNLGTSGNHRAIIDRWDGTSWHPVGTGYGNYHSSTVYSLCVYDNAVCAAGAFDSIGGTAANNIAYWDGIKWGTLYNGIRGAVYSLGAYNSELYAGGEFSVAGSVLASNVAAWTGPLGVNTIQEATQSVKLFPNPNNGKFTIQLANSYKLTANSSLEVYNMLGEKIYSTSFTINYSQFTIDLGPKSAGVYMYRVLTETGDLVSEGKFVIE
jgi:hypothetical protein